MSILQLVSLLGGVALFLFGMTLMGDGLTKVSGSKLEPILFRLSGTPLRALLLGTGVTAVIQSSCATSVHQRHSRLDSGHQYYGLDPLPELY